MSGSTSSPLGQINLRSSPVWSCSHGAKCHSWEGASRTNNCIMTSTDNTAASFMKGVTSQVSHKCIHLDFLLRAETVETGTKSARSMCIFEDAVSSYKLVWSKSRPNGDDFTSALEPRSAEIIRKDVFRAFFSLHIPIIQFCIRALTKIPV